jgi:phage protein D
MAEPRRAWITVEYDGKDITEAVSNSVLTFEYTDNASGEADSLDITVHDREGRWREDYYPKVRVGGKEDGG